MKNIQKKIVILCLFLFLCILFLTSDVAKIFHVGVDPYLFVNDTPNQINGSICGSTSPCYALNIPANERRFININRETTPEILKTNSFSKKIISTKDWRFLKIIHISRLGE